MFRLWGKIMRDNHMIADYVVEDDSGNSRTKKVFAALDTLCLHFDLSRPIWLDSTVNDFRRHGKARFYQDNFIDPIDFDFLEIQMIEED